MTSFWLGLAIIIVDYGADGPGGSAIILFPVIPENPPGEGHPGERAHQRQPGEGMGEDRNNAGHSIIAEKNRIVSVPFGRPAVK